MHDLSPLGNSRSFSTPRLFDDDHGKLVSWLAAGTCHYLDRLLRIAFPDLSVQWPMDAHTPLTVAGAARALHPVPITCRSRNTVREKLATVNLLASPQPANPHPCPSP
jgi:hypothetical protein